MLENSIQKQEQYSNISSLSDQNRASNFVKSIIRDVMDKKQMHFKSEGFDKSKDTQQQQQYFSLSQLSKMDQDQENQENINIQNLTQYYPQYPAKSPNSVSKLFKKVNHSSQNSIRMPLNEYVQRTHRQNTQSPYQINNQLQQYHSPNLSRTNCTQLETQQRSQNLSVSQLCNFCRQSMNISVLCDNHEQKKTKNKKKQLGYYSYNFIYVVGQNNQNDKQKQKQNQKEKEKEKEKNFNNLRNSKDYQQQLQLNGIDEVYQSQNLKSSKKQPGLQSFDFELSVSQVQRDQVISAKERQFSEVCISQAVSQDLNQQRSNNKEQNHITNNSPVNGLENCYFKSASIQKDKQNIKQQVINNQMISESIQIVNLDFIKQSILKMNEQERQNIMQFFELELRRREQNISALKQKDNYKQSLNFEENILTLQKLMPPIEERIKKISQSQSQNQTQFSQNNKDFRSDPMELAQATIDQIKKDFNLQQTPISKMLDRLDVSDIQPDSIRASPSETFQMNLLKEFEKQQNRCAQPQKLIKKVQQQIDELKIFSKKPSEIRQLSRCPSKQKQQKILTHQNSQPSLYQKVLKNGIKK